MPCVVIVAERLTQDCSSPLEQAGKRHSFLRHSFRPLFIAFLLVSACNVCAVAQSSRTGASLEGRVIDSSGAVVPNAAVSLRNSSVNETRTVRTDSGGLFSAEELPTGTYEIRVDQPGFAPYRHTNIVLA